MRLFSRSTPKVKVQSTRKDGFSGWLKCSGCNELIHAKDLETSVNCCPKCNYHYRIFAKERIKLIIDADSFEEMYADIRPVDILGFVDTKSYQERIHEAQEKSGLTEGVIVGTAKLYDQPIAIGAMDFSYMGGSMGSVVGEKITRIIEVSLEHRLPLIFVSASGGARMQESIFSLMQMAKTAAALAKLHEAKIPFISVLTNPTSGGVTASFASLGDVILAEPKALICFAGPRVIEQVIQQKLPEGAQSSEFLLEHGWIDSIVRRSEMRKKLSFFVDFLTPDKPKKRRAKKPSKSEKMQDSLEELIERSKVTTS